MPRYINYGNGAEAIYNTELWLVGAIWDGRIGQVFLGDSLRRWVEVMFFGDAITRSYVCKSARCNAELAGLVAMLRLRPRPSAKEAATERLRG